MDMNKVILEYFSNPGEYVTWDKKGNQVRTRNVPTVDGFAAMHDIPPKRVLAEITEDTRDLCQAKFNDIVIQGGMNRSYDSGFAVKAMENVGNWSKEATATTTNILIVGEADRRMLERAGITGHHIYNTLEAEPRVVEGSM